MITASSAPPPRSREQLVFTYLYGAILGGVTLWQLMRFEKFTPFIEALVGNSGLVVAVGLISLQVFSMPFLLRLDMSQLARTLSAAFVLLGPLCSTLLVIGAMITGRSVPGADLYLIMSLIFLTTASFCFWALSGRKVMLK